MFCKIQNKFTPDYLHNVIVGYQRKGPTLGSLRSNTKLISPFCRTHKFKTSFFPSTIDSWNFLDINIRNVISVHLFKSALSASHVIDRRVRVFNSLHGVKARTLMQIRLGLSDLRGQLFRYVLVDNPFCPLCLDAIETSSHFFLDCPMLICQRDKLFSKLKILIPSFEHFSSSDQLNVLTSGIGNFNFNQNCTVLANSINFINASGRFTSDFFVTS